MTTNTYEGVNTPYPMGIDRESPQVGLMSQSGDPVLDMTYSLRNIEYLCWVQTLILKELKKNAEAANGEESHQPVDGSKKRGS